jgi:hypothetical protein
LRTRRTVLLLTAAALSTVGAVALPGSSSAKAAAPVFGHEVIIDHQRSGFEPDIAIDSKNRYFSSVPNGSSQAHSFIWNSLDQGESWQQIPGQAGFGKPLTCPQGGGDTELAMDAGDNLYLSDLQNLSNLSNAVSTDGGMTWKPSCTSAPNAPVDRMWYASHGKLGDPDFAIYEEYDAVLSGANPDSPIGNQLVETVSHDGFNFTPVINSAPSPACLGGGVVNCVTNEEGIPGNQVMAKNGDLLIAHTGQDGNKVLVSRGKLTTTGTGEAAVTTATWKDTVVNASICPDKGTQVGICGAANFPTIATDSAGHFYVVFSSQEMSGSNARGPYHVYVVSSKDGDHWSKPVQIDRDGSNAFPWITAGSNGRVAVAWYHANEESEHNHYMFDDLAHAEFSVQVGTSLDALAAKPHYTVTTASEHPIKYGPICTAGTTCTVSQGDRSLGDYLQIGHDRKGALVLVYVDDTSNTYTTGPTGAVAENGSPVMVKQIGGPSLIAGTISGPRPAVDKVSDRGADAFYSANSRRTPAGDNLDLTAASITEDKTGLVVTMKVRALEGLAVDPTAGGTTGTWITQFTTYNPGTPGNGHIYYAGMESIGGSAPRFFDGDVAAPNPAGVQLSMVYDSSHAVTGSYKPNGTITLHVPWADIPGAKRGQELYSATAFTGTTVGTLAGNPAGIINVIDSTAPFNHRRR